ncbi:MAG: aspartate--ammonia ligase [Defluviitaleaceae bacterium]|nr:aspartate--ammonia ligase [Defluviitaleaceae bacterium]MCL2262232.1 aspartate--ammonia ligase [Defluviitaleaceae bacterium]
MGKIIVPEGYKSLLSLYETQTAIGKMKRIFEDKLAQSLSLKRVSAPLFVEPHTGLNDDLNGIERAVAFDVKETGQSVEIVHSLAKWKRLALSKYDFHVGNGLYTDMNAIRRDDEMDNLHSIYVDQWDWEKVIDTSMRNENFLRETVSAIVAAICDTEAEIAKIYPVLTPQLKREVKFITTQELEDMYPNKTAKERENAAAEKYGTVFLMQIGGALKSGKPHDGRAPDYDDWSLNGDILFYNHVLKSAIEISSMGIRVDAATLDRQLNLANCNERRNLPFHKQLLNSELPLTIGGGIGQSRLSLLLLQKAHIGEVQVSVWDTDTTAGCKQADISLL